MDPNLPKVTGALTFGYGSGGAPALTFDVPEDQDLDIGFLKLFVSTKAIDLSHIVQQSPFNIDRGIKALKLGGMDDFWATLTVPVIQRLEKSVTLTRSHM